MKSTLRHMGCGGWVRSIKLGARKMYYVHLDIIGLLFVKVPKSVRSIVFYILSNPFPRGECAEFRPLSSS